MSRASLPRKIKDALLDEYNHRCAICGGDRPHVHHIDEDTSDNDIHNLLPLCPNCHLTDQHNPTTKIDIPKLSLFRIYKDPAILKPQFHPVFVRQVFLDSVDSEYADPNELAYQAEELADFVKELEMGSFYSKRIRELLSPINPTMAELLTGEIHQERESPCEYRERLISNRAVARSLLVEQLRFQRWANEV